jgi:LysM repeat protein
MELDDRLLAKLTIEPYADLEFKQPVGVPWKALFNPTELSFTRKNKYNVGPLVGKSKPQISYGGGELEELALDLFLDGTGVVASTQSVEKRVKALLDMASFQGDTHLPYYLKVHWGRYEFRGVLTQAAVTYTLHDRLGQALRAKVKVTLMEAVAPKVASAEAKEASPDLYQTWTVKQGERLEHIAYAVYGDAGYWRPLAEANGLRNPRALAAGQPLVLPPIAADAA